MGLGAPYSWGFALARSTSGFILSPAFTGLDSTNAFRAIIRLSSRGYSATGESEPQLEAELDDARSAPCPSDLAEITAAQVSSRISEGRRVGDVVSLGPEFERDSFLQPGHLRNADVDAPLIRPDHSITAQRAESDAGAS